jgi:pyruvate formate lyase activating enzyme
VTAEARCGVCPHHCKIPEGGLGICGARTCENGEIGDFNFGLVSAVALDPIEKKPLANFHPGSKVLSVGGFGCSFRCPFCQNSDISMVRGASVHTPGARILLPDELVSMAEGLSSRGNIGVAFTYNEPTTSFDYLLHSSRAVHEAGMLNVVVSNGYICEDYLTKLLPYIDAWNIDLKAYDQSFYDMVGAPEGLSTVKRAIELASKSSHVEVTTLVIPGLNDSESQMEEESSWLASLGSDITLHITRFFPRYKMTDRPPTPKGTLAKLANVASRHLGDVRLGNV